MKESIKEIVIDSLYESAVKICKNPELYKEQNITCFGYNVNDKNIQKELNDKYTFEISWMNEINEVGVYHNNEFKIGLNYDRFLRLNEITRLFMLMWFGFIHFDAGFLLSLLSNEMDVDSDTVSYLKTKGRLLDNNEVNDLLSCFSEIISEYGITSRSVKRENNLSSLLIDLKN